MLKYNDLFLAQNFAVDVIELMGDNPLEGMPWVFKIPWDKPLTWPEIKFIRKSI